MELTTNPVHGVQLV